MEVKKQTCQQIINGIKNEKLKESVLAYKENLKSLLMSAAKGISDKDIPLQSAGGHGHTVSFHCKMSDEEMLKRSIFENHDVSSFYSKSGMRSVIGNGLIKNLNKLAVWKYKAEISWDSMSDEKKNQYKNFNHFKNTMKQQMQAYNKLVIQAKDTSFSFSAGHGFNKKMEEIVTSDAVMVLKRDDTEQQHGYGFYVDTAYPNLDSETAHKSGVYYEPSEIIHHEDKSIWQFNGYENGFSDKQIASVYLATKGINEDLIKSGIISSSSSVDNISVMRKSLNSSEKKKELIAYNIYMKDASRIEARYFGSDEKNKDRLVLTLKQKYGQNIPVNMNDKSFRSAYPDAVKVLKKIDSCIEKQLLADKSERVSEKSKSGLYAPAMKHYGGGALDEAALARENTRICGNKQISTFDVGEDYRLMKKILCNPGMESAVSAVSVSYENPSKQFLYIKMNKELGLSLEGIMNMAGYRESQRGNADKSLFRTQMAGKEKTALFEISQSSEKKVEDILHDIQKGIETYTKIAPSMDLVGENKYVKIHTSQCGDKYWHGFYSQSEGKEVPALISVESSGSKYHVVRLETNENYEFTVSAQKLMESFHDTFYGQKKEDELISENVISRHCCDSPILHGRGEAVNYSMALNNYVCSVFEQVQGVNLREKTEDVMDKASHIKAVELMKDEGIGIDSTDLIQQCGIPELFHDGVIAAAEQWVFDNSVDYFDKEEILLKIMDVFESVSDYELLQDEDIGRNEFSENIQWDEIGK